MQSEGPATDRNSTAPTARSGGTTGLLPLVVAAVAIVAATAWGYQITFASDSVGRDVRTALPANAGIPALQQAASADPGNAELWKRLGNAQRRAGNRNAAVSAFVRAARIAPDDRQTIDALRDLAGTPGAAR